jgi:hypothetical protein
MEPIQADTTTGKLFHLIVFLIVLTFFFAFIYMYSGHLVFALVVTLVLASYIPLSYIFKKLPWAKEHKLGNILNGLFHLFVYLGGALILLFIYMIAAGFSFSLSDTLSPRFWPVPLGIFIFIVFAIIYARLYPEIFK